MAANDTATKKDFQPLIDWLGGPKSADSFPAVWTILRLVNDEFPLGNSSGFHSGYIWYSEPRVGLKKFIPGDLVGVLGPRGNSGIAPSISVIIAVAFTIPVTVRLAWVADGDQQKFDVAHDLRSVDLPSQENLDPNWFHFHAHKDFASDEYSLYFHLVAHPNLVIPSSIFKIPKNPKPHLP